MTLTPGARVVIAAPCPGWLPWTTVGSVAEVVHTGEHATVIRLLTPRHADRALRYVPAPAVADCLVPWNGKE